MSAICDWCNEPLSDRRRKYHESCRKSAQKAAQAARRRCKRCKKVKAASSFSHDSTRPDNKFPWCMDCQNEHGGTNRWQDENAPLTGTLCPMCDAAIRGHTNRVFCSASCKERAANLRRNFGLTIEQFRALVAATNGRCPICDRRVTEWHIDHNHTTGLVTGVVCSGCNVGPLAYSYHNIALIQRLLKYLSQTPAELLGIYAKANPDMNKPSNLHDMWKHKRRA